MGKNINLGREKREKKKNVSEETMNVGKKKFNNFDVDYCFLSNSQSLMNNSMDWNKNNLFFLFGDNSLSLFSLYAKL